MFISWIIAGSVPSRRVRALVTFPVLILPVLLVVPSLFSAYTPSRDLELQKPRDETCRPSRFATRILTEECLGESYGSRKRTYPGLMRLAYLHPNVFSPDPEIRGELGVSEEERLFLVRLAAFDAYHDFGQHGFSGALLRRTIDRLTQEGRVFICSEAPLTGDYASFALPVAASRLHHVLAACDLVLGDGLTVCVEAALLGTPAIAIGSYMGKHSYFRELEQRFGLMWGFRAVQEEEFLSCVANVLRRHDLKEEWQGRRAAMLEVWGDPTDVFWEELHTLLCQAGSGETPILNPR